MADQWGEYLCIQEADRALQGYTGETMEKATDMTHVPEQIAALSEARKREIDAMAKRDADAVIRTFRRAIRKLKILKRKRT